MAIKYKWLTNRLKELIINNIEMGINKLPAEKELCARYKVSRQTVRLSLSLLEAEGLIIKKRGSGSYLTGLTADASGNTIGILISDDADYIYPGLIYDLQDTLAHSGFALKVFVTGNRTHTERKILEELLEHPLRGIIVEGCKSALPNPNLDLYHKLKKKGCAILFLHNHYPALNECIYVKDDNIGGGTLLTNHLISCGHTAIGGIFKFDDLQGPERYLGFTQAMHAFRLPIPDERISWFHSTDLDRLTLHKDTRFLQEIIQNALATCTAVICYNDMIAYHLTQELLLAGYHLPEDMTIAAFDNTYLSNSKMLSITTLSHPPHELGTLAARMMIDKLKGLPVKQQEIPWELKIKESTAQTS